VLSACSPPPCTPSSCTAGQVCCIGGAVSAGIATCISAEATGACPGNARLVCATDADCAAVPGTRCATSADGLDQLSCRVPLPAAEP
jgi:hypothetical protein